MRYVEDTGTVVSVSDDKATIRLDHKHPDSCGSGCACSALSGDDRSVTVDRGELQQGDRVMVRIPHVNANMSMLLLFVLPMVMFFVGAAVGGALSGTERVGMPSLLGGGVGFGLALALAWAVNRKLTRRAAPEAHRATADS